MYLLWLVNTKTFDYKRIKLSIKRSNEIPRKTTQYLF